MRATQSLTPLFIALLALTTGCATHQSDLTLASNDQQHTFKQTFSQAFYDRDDAGTTDIILVSDAAAPHADDPDQPIAPAPSAAMRQLVHIRILWLPLTGKADHPAGTNASVQWCIIGPNPNPAQSDFLEYTGSGLVSFNDSGRKADAFVSTAWMKVLTQRGSMSDPIGPANLTGTIHATRDPAQVHALITEINIATQSPAATNP